MRGGKFGFAATVWDSGGSCSPPAPARLSERFGAACGTTGPAAMLFQARSSCSVQAQTLPTLRSDCAGLQTEAAEVPSSTDAQGSHRAVLLPAGLGIVGAVGALLEAEGSSK